MASDGAPDIENLEILELLGQGGMSRVFKARQIDLDRIVAVKVLNKVADAQAMQRFKNEAKNTSLLEHPNIVRTLSFGLSKDQQPFLLMEYLEGKSLAELIEQQGSLDYRRFRNIFLPVLSALQTAHEKEIVHRDIKPGNIMICKDASGNEQAKLVDFGISKTFMTDSQQNLTKSGAILGSPTYMSPEQCQGQQLDKRSDLYSLSCVMYESLVGEPPFSGESMLEIMQKHVGGALPEPKDVRSKIDINKDLLKTILWGLEKIPDSRPQSASNFAEKLANALERVTLDKLPILKQPHKKPAVMLAVISIAVAAGSSMLIANNNKMKTISEHGQTVTVQLDKRKEKDLQAKLAKAIETRKPLPVINALRELADYYEKTGYYILEARILEQVSAHTKVNNCANNNDLINLANAYCKSESFENVIFLLKSRMPGFTNETEYLRAGNLLAAASVALKSADSRQILLDLQSKEKGLPALNREKIETDALYARYLINAGKLDEAEACLKKLAEKRKSLQESNDTTETKVNLSDTLLELAELEIKRQKPEEASIFLKSSIALNGNNTEHKRLLQNSIESLNILQSLYLKDGELKLAKNCEEETTKLLEESVKVNGKKTRLSEYLRSCNKDMQFRGGIGDIDTWRLRVRQIDYLSSDLGKRYDVLQYLTAMTKYQLMLIRGPLKERLATLHECLIHSYDQTGKPTFETGFVFYNLGIFEETDMKKSIDYLKKADLIFRNPQTVKLPIDYDFAQARNTINVKHVQIAIGDSYQKAKDFEQAEKYYILAIELAGKEDPIQLTDAATRCAKLLAIEGRKDAAAEIIKSVSEKVANNPSPRATELLSHHILEKLQLLESVGLNSEAKELAYALRNAAEAHNLTEVKSRMDMYLEIISKTDEKRSKQPL